MNGLQKEIENRHLPELMRLENGDAVTNYEDWKLRREEIKKILCHEYMGVTPENIKSAFECVGVDEDAYGGKATEMYLLHGSRLLYLIYSHFHTPTSFPLFTGYIPAFFFSVISISAILRLLL